MHLFIRFVPVSIGNLNHVSRTFCGICGQNHGLGDMNEYEALTPFDPDYVIPWDFAAEYRAEGGGPSLKLTKVKDQWLFTGRNANQVPIVCVSETEFKVPGQ
ncbi:MAG: hypothetical protein KJT03_08625 [Verrucomicrobiae bacterium]|nr:hypothetical protein [Verrucomicrobiae bacterium]